MIDSIHGEVAAKRPPAVCIDTGGVVYEILCPLPVFEKTPAVGEHARLLVEFIVRAESQALYGFFTTQEREVFRRLLKVSGVGAKTALGAMSGFSLDELMRALREENVAALARLPGIGKKTAARLALEFRGSALAPPPGAERPAVHHEVALALSALGYGKSEVDKGLAALADCEEERDVSALIRIALKKLSG